MRWKTYCLLFFIIVGIFSAPIQSNAASVLARKSLVVGKAALYGFGAGLVVGLASQVIKKRTKNIFIGGSLGLYAGIATGLYLIWSASEDVKGYEGPDTYDEFQGWDSMILDLPSDMVRVPAIGENRDLMQARLEKKIEISLFSTDF